MKGGPTSFAQPLIPTSSLPAARRYPSLHGPVPVLKREQEGAAVKLCLEEGDDGQPTAISAISLNEVSGKVWKSLGFL